MSLNPRGSLLSCFLFSLAAQLLLVLSQALLLLGGEGLLGLPGLMSLLLSQEGVEEPEEPRNPRPLPRASGALLGLLLWPEPLAQGPGVHAHSF